MQFILNPAVYLVMLSQALLIFPLLSVKFSQLCYFPDGTIALDDPPCNSTAPESTCCGRTYACLSNSICEATSETRKKPGSATFVRGSCTDASWISDACPKFCLSRGAGERGGTAGIGKCSNGEDDEYYCLDDAKSDCGKHENVLLLSGKIALYSSACAYSY